jgi:hypothetical protein
VTGTTPTIVNASQATTTLQIPAEAQFTLQLTVTDDQGTQDTKEIALATLSPTPPPDPTPTPSPAPSGTSGGGGGQLGWELLGIGLVGLVRRRARVAAKKKSKLV